MSCQTRLDLSNPAKRVKCLESVIKPCVIGVRQEESDSLKADHTHPDAMTCLVSFDTMNQHPEVTKDPNHVISFMPESQLEVSKNTLQIKSMISSIDMENNAQSSQMLEVDSTSKGQALRRFWKRSSEAKYAGCLCPTKTACVVSHSISSNSFVPETEQKSSWQKMEIRRPLKQSWQMMSCPSSQFLGLACTDPVVNAEVGRGPMSRKVPLKGKLRSYKIRMFPTAQQKGALKTWFAAARRAYNQAIHMMQNEHKSPNLISLRKEIVPIEKLTTEWEKDVPTKIRARAVQQAVDAVKIGRKSGKMKMMSFRSLKKSATETLVIEKAFGGSKGPVNGFKQLHSKHIGVCFAPKTSLGKLGSVLMRDKQWLCNKLVQDNALLEDALLKWEKAVGAFYLIIRTEEKCLAEPDPQWSEKRIVALDPGERTFQTFYSPDGTHGQLLTNTKAYIHKKCHKIDTVKSHLSNVKNDKSLNHMERWRKVHRQNMLIQKLHYKIKCFRHNAHYAAANFLLRQWDIVMIPKFEVSKMVRKGERRVMGKQSTRDMYNWGHYEFRQRLISKSFKYAGRHVIIINEPGTSKTCGICGAWNAELGGNKVFRCQSCHVELDRDVNGARNNLMAQIG